MPTYKQMVDAFAIMAKYEESGMDTFIGGADHDVIYGSDTEPEEMTPEDVAALGEAGWRYNEYHDCWCCFC